MSELRERLRVATLPDGRRALIVDCEIPAQAPEQVREGLARRAIVNGGGTCPPPCGASWRPNREQRRRMKQPGTVTYLDVVHADGCPAITEFLVAAIHEWEPSR